jgi:hypothetical protein
MIREKRGSSIEDLKLRRKEEESTGRCEGQVISTDLIQVVFEAIPFAGGPIM